MIVSKNELSGRGAAEEVLGNEKEGLWWR